MPDLIIEETVDPGEGTSSKWRTGLIWLSAIVAFATLAYLTYFVFNTHPKPSEIDAGYILLFSCAAFALLVIPWQKIEFIPTEIAGVKFERILGAQKKEQIEEFVAIRNDIKNLRARLDALDVPGRLPQISAAADRPSLPDIVVIPTPEPTKPKIAAQSVSDELTTLLIKFFTTFKGSFFSVSRIRNWGGQQKDFESLKQFTHGQIKAKVFDLVAENTLRTAISQRGNTIYGLSGRSSLVKR